MAFLIGKVMVHLEDHTFRNLWHVQQATPLHHQFDPLWHILLQMNDLLGLLHTIQVPKTKSILRIFQKYERTYTGTFGMGTVWALVSVKRRDRFHSVGFSFSELLMNWIGKHRCLTDQAHLLSEQQMYLSQNGNDLTLDSSLHATGFLLKRIMEFSL